MYLSLQKTAFGILILGIVTLMGCASSQMEIRKNIKNADISVKDVQFNKMPLGENGVISLKLTLEVLNPTDKLMKLDSIVSVVRLDSLTVAEIKHLNHIDINPKISHLIELDIESNLGVMEWMSLLAGDKQEVEVDFEGVAWSRVKYLGFWDSMKETTFKITKSIPKSVIEDQLKGFLAKKMQRILGLPGGLLDKVMDPLKSF